MTPDVAYFVFGLVLVASLLAIIGFYYSKKRKAHVEQAKYKMLDDDE